MPRFFKSDIENAPFLENDDAKHIAKSLRMKSGEKLTVSDGLGNDYFCEITDVSAEKIDLKIYDKQPNKTEPTVEVTLFQCLPKNDKMDTIVKQSVEMGVCKIVPVISTNCVSRPDAKTLIKKCERWQKIAFEAAGQSGRGIIPSVLETKSFKQVLAEVASFDKFYFFYENGGITIASIPATHKKIGIIIGSEGGFTEKEAEELQQNGAVTTTLGPRILRAETAPVAALAIIMANSDNMK